MILFSSIYLLMGCSSSTSSFNQIKTEEPFASSNKVIQGKSLTKDDVKEFVKKNQDSYEELNNIKEDEIMIEVKTCKGENLYFFTYTPTDSWNTSLYRIRQQQGEVLGLDYISEGATDYFQFDIINISEGDYVSVYSTSYMGIGYLSLVNLKSTEDRKVGTIPDYEFYAVDSHYEQMQFDKAPVLSSVFENAKLTPEYTDVNEDGHTDILLRGVIEDYEYDIETDMQNLKSRKEVCQIYEYEPETKQFILKSGEDLREKRQISLCDSVLNNHELLNDSLCSEYKVQDIYQYSGEPKKIITQKCEEGMYRHYMVYDGIIYIVHGEKAIDEMQYIDYVILTNEIFSLAIGIQVGMEERELADTGLYFESFENGDDLDSELLSGKTGYLRKMKIKYDTIYYAEGSFEENIALAVIVRDGKIVRIATDKLY